MKSIEAKRGRVIVGKVLPDEDLIDSINAMVKKHQVKSALFNVIGAFKKVTIGYYDISSKEYNFQTFEEDLELISCIGNIAYKDNKPIIHAHITVGRSDYTIIGGHLSQPSIISVTGEVFIYEIDKIVLRAKDPKFDLNLLDL
ncbi:MAG: DUF296 domain-containing protein [Candidatus Lokiarchaeota archaeon]|nr:DUF296 domain-containing protein [Candidatus Lokiarchaeota archaeon]MBD3342586.1 DUF296 domain-containing protein [Candidatus Lokiarchaeota archaeon]